MQFPRLIFIICKQNGIKENTKYNLNYIYGKRVVKNFDCELLCVKCSFFLNAESLYSMENPLWVALSRIAMLCYTNRAEFKKGQENVVVLSK